MKHHTATLRQVYLNSKAAVCVGLALLTAFAPSMSLALEVKLQQSINLRTNDGTTLSKVGKLAAGSIVSIPDDYAVRTNGVVDFEQTLNNWLAKASTLGTNEAPGLKRFSGEKKDFYFPIKVVKEAPGSTLAGKETYMVALRYLQRKGALLETTQDTDLNTFVNAENAPNAEEMVVAASGREAVTQSAPQQGFEASGISVCSECESTQSLHPLAAGLQLALDSNLRRPLDKMVNRTANHTDDAAERFEKTCGMRIDHFVSALQREIAASPLRTVVPTSLNSTMMLGLMTQETTGNCKSKGDHGTSIGLFQVNQRSSGLSQDQLHHPITNARAALDNLEAKQAALSKDFDFSKMTETDRLRVLVSSYNGGEKWVRRAKDDLEQFNRRQGANLNAHNWEHLRIFYFRRHLNSANESQTFGSVRGKEQRSVKNALSNLAYTENLLPRPDAIQGATLQDSWHRRLNG